MQNKTFENSKNLQREYVVNPLYVQLSVSLVSSGALSALEQQVYHEHEQLQGVSVFTESGNASTRLHDFFKRTYMCSPYPQQLSQIPFAYLLMAVYYKDNHHARTNNVPSKVNPVVNNLIMYASHRTSTEGNSKEEVDAIILYFMRNYKQLFSEKVS